MPLPRDEIETCIVQPWDTALPITITTSDPAEMRRLEGLGVKPDCVGIIDGEPVSWVFHVPGDWTVTCRPKKQMSEENRTKAAERMRQLHKGV